MAGEPVSISDDEVEQAQVEQPENDDSLSMPRPSQPSALDKHPVMSGESMFVTDEEEEDAQPEQAQSEQTQSEQAQAEQSTTEDSLTLPRPSQPPDPGIQLLGSNSRDMHAKDVCVRDRPNATRWSLSTRQVPAVCDPTYQFAREFLAHDVEKGPFIFKQATTQTFDMFVQYLHVWVHKGAPKVDSYNLLDWVRLWILAERIGAPLVQNFAMSQIDEVFTERVSTDENDNFLEEVNFLWAERKKGDMLREYFLHAFRAAGLGGEHFFRNHDKKFVLELHENLRQNGNGGIGKSGMRTHLNKRDFHEKVPAKRRRVR